MNSKVTSITNDKQLRQQLDALDISQQRSIALLFVKNIMHLNTNEQIQKLLDTADHPDSNDQDLATTYKQIKSIATQTYTDCGSETDWQQQAEHFIATSLMACLTPEKLLSKGKSLVWKTAMQTRMAKNCEMIEQDSGDIDNEATKQYQLAEQFLQQLHA